MQLHLAHHPLPTAHAQGHAVQGVLVPVEARRLEPILESNDRIVALGRVHEARQRLRAPHERVRHGAQLLLRVHHDRAADDVEEP